MKTNGHWLFLALLLGATPLAAMTGCGRTTANSDAGSGGITNPGLGGTIGQGGNTGSGGITAPGGITGQGGEASSGGITGRGGTTGQGGNVGSGGGGGTTSTVVKPRPPAIHRPEALSCVGVHSPPEPPNPLPSTASKCARHADCTAGTNGKCVNGIGYSGSIYNCIYDQCATDADCDAGKVCHCNSTTAARCLSVGNCRTDADCGGGDYSYCSSSMGHDCGGYHTIDSYVSARRWLLYGGEAEGIDGLLDPSRQRGGHDLGGRLNDDERHAIADYLKAL
jgi:hypothetical protein